MSDYKVLRLSLSDATGVMLSDAKVLAKTEAGQMLTDGAIRYMGITGICTDYSGNIYGCARAQNCIVKIDEGGKVSWFAGSQTGVSGNNGTRNNVEPYSARFNAPKAIACDKSGTLYIVDETNEQIRTIKNGRVNVLAGSAGLAGFVDGEGEVARFNNPQSIAVDKAGVVWVADMGNHAIRKITNDGTVLTVAGNGIAGDTVNGRASKLTRAFSSPSAVAVDTQGNVYISDNGNYSIKKYTTNGWLYRFSGGGNVGRSLGTDSITVAGVVTKTSKAFTCSYTDVRDLAADASGNVYVVDHMTSAGRLLKLDRDGVPSEVYDWNGNSYHGPYAIAVSPAQTLFIANVVT